MKILAISDVPSKLLWDESVRKRLEGIDLILSCGDLPKKYLEYPTRLNDGTMQLLKMAERQLCDGEIHVFPTESYSQGHALHHAASGIYTPKELMEMDWLEECVEGELPSYDELDAKTRSLLNVNGLDIVKGTPQ